jgi:hypothetical protein
MLMRYKEKNGGGHASVSLATQVGCSHPCMYNLNTPFVRNLTTAELLEQVVHATRVLVQENSDHKSRHLIQNVALMGTGEPLDNYDNVVEACQMLSDSKMWGLRRGRITISTIGITPRIYDLTRDLPDVILAVSLHAPNQQLRRTIVPSAEHYKMEGLIEAIDNHMDCRAAELSPRAAAADDDESQASSTTRRRNVMLEYILGKLRPVVNPVNPVTTKYSLTILSLYLSQWKERPVPSNAHMSWVSFVKNEMSSSTSFRILARTTMTSIVVQAWITSRSFSPPWHLTVFFVTFDWQ